MAEFPPVFSDPMTGYAVNPVVHCSTRLMTQPGKSQHVRAAEFRLPRFESAPTVSVTITALEGSSPLTVYSVKVNDHIDGSTQIAIEAQTILGGDVEGEHHCSIVVTGVPLLHIAARRTQLDQGQ